MLAWPGLSANDFFICPSKQNNSSLQLPDSGTQCYSRIERTGPNTVVSFTVVQFHRWFLNWNWHSPIPFLAPRPTWTMWSV